ncbi:MAG: glycoside hydrolase family 2 protein [Lachnospiraceae bacterium]|nr:glycoside hydrolase family 2 protein [Lachnospiraceae bacterium]
MKKILLEDNWKLRRTDQDEMLDAKVPGSVYCDLLNNGKMEDPYWKDNEDEVLKLMDYDYEYTTVFDVEKDVLEMSEVELVFEGLDTIADIILNDQNIDHTENMHRTYKYPVKDILREKDNKLTVIFRSPTKYIDEAFKKAPTLGTEDAMNGFVHIRKAHYMFGWDWGAHLPDAGIWRPVYLLGIDSAKIETVSVLQFHENDEVRLELEPEITLFDVGCQKTVTLDKESTLSGIASKKLAVAYEIKNPDGELIIEGAYELTSSNSDNQNAGGKDIVIKNPMLWWPNGFGKQYLYTVIVKIKDENDKVLDVWERRIGLRTITMDRSKDEWGERFATCVNGVNIFAMGADYIPEDHLLGRVNKETTKTLLEKAVFANFNSIRVWGGGHYPEDWFFDLCDEMGLIVWEDFMFACAVYDLTPEFEENIKAEIEDNLKRMRHHASLGLMCGNNEMEQFVKERTWVSKDSEVRDYIIMYERIMPMMMKKYAPQVYYWPASPSSGGSFDDPRDENRGDVHYWDVWHGNKPFSEYRKFYFRYLSEFGFQSFPSKKTVETFTDDEHDMNIFSYIMEKHQRNGAANGKIMNYMQQTYRYPSSFENVIYASQLLQADAIRYGVEHFRRNRNDSRCMGAVYWQFNDCWPVASWSSVDYCQRLKALHYYARRFFNPIMISCEEEGMMGSGQELVRLPFEFNKSIHLNVTNETLFDEDLVVNWEIRNSSGEVLRYESKTVTVPSLSSVWLDKVELPDIKIYDEYVSFNVCKEGEVLSEGTVIFSYPKYFRYQNPELKYEVNGNKITVSASSYAKSVEILNENEDLILSDNYFDLNGDSRTVEVISGDIKGIKLKSVYDIN